MPVSIARYQIIIPKIEGHQQVSFLLEALQSKKGD